jgi:hypothetical protein
LTLIQDFRVGRVCNTIARSCSAYDLKYHVVWITDSGDVTDEVMMQYLESQDVEQKDDDFRITGKPSADFSRGVGF